MTRDELHPLLKRQVHRIWGARAIPDEWTALLRAVDQSYRQADADREMLERSMELSSQELLQANRDLRAIFAMLPDMFLRVSADGIILDCDLGEFIGDRGLDDWRGQRLNDCACSCNGAFREMVEESQRTGERIVREIEMQRGDILLHVEASVIPMHAGECVLFVRDITARHKAEETERRLSVAIEQSADSVLITDPDGALLYVNSAFEAMFGYSRDEVIGRRPSILKSGQHDQPFYEALWRIIKAGQMWRGRLTDRCKDGSLIELHTVISPIRNTAGAITNYVAISQDVTRAIALEEQLRQAQKMEAIGRLAGGIAHDFNNLLSSIIGNTDLTLRRIGPGAPMREDLELIRMAAERGASLIAQLLTFSRKQVANLRVLQVNELVENMVRLLKGSLSDKIELIVNLAEDPGLVRGDQTQIEQTIMNLVLNARDAMPDGGRLTLSTRSVRLDNPREAGFADLRPGPHVVLAVSDTGVGISPEIQSRIFEPFFTTKEVGRGTGLGLSTVYGIVQQAGGSIQVQSELGKGTTFTVYWPQVRAGLPMNPPPAASSQPARARRTILLVDDDLSVRKMISRTLVEEGYNVLEARDGEEAIGVLRLTGSDINLVLSDIVMPKVDGAELARLLRTEFPALPVIFMTGFCADEKVVGLDLREGVNLICKPFHPSQLFAMVAAVFSPAPQA
ncbi:MAG: PAS domain S-box protein [Verrucomicrobia bacterium]|nr:PAS domain S-box protein [Verrucomicrobiota bacterium]